MKRAALLLILFSFLFFNLHSQIIQIPEDYSTIQQGINAAGEGDTVLVAPGTYYENLDFNYDNITLASHFLVTGDTSYISATVIDGSSLGPVILVRHYQDATTLICGFSIMSGESSYGGGLYIYNASPVLEHLNIYYNAAQYGGGIYLKSCHPVIRNCRIENNYASYYGGGLYCNYSTNTTLEQVTITGNNSEYGGGGIYCYQNNDLFLSGTDITYNHSGTGGGLSWSYQDPSLSFDTINRCNIYLNSADYHGSDLYSFEGTFEIIVDTFTVRYPTDFHAEEIAKFNFDILSGKLLQVDTDLYVSPSGNDTNTGLTPEDPLRTIRSAYSRLRADSGHISTVHLANGLYSPSTGQKFPLYLPNYSRLSGESMEQTILDAEETNTTIILENDTIPMLENLTIKGGKNYWGGGISSHYSEFHGEKLLITGNSSTHNGGGVYILNNDKCSLKNSIVENNTSVDGGGIFALESGIELHSVEFHGNTANWGGGLEMEDCSSAILSNVKFSNNQANSMGGGLYAFRTSNLTISNSEFDSNTAADGGGVHSRYSSLEIRNSLFTNNMGIHTGSGVELYGNLLPDSANIEARIINSTFVGNTTPALFCYNASASLINNIFWGNAGPYQVQCQEADTIADTLRIINSTIQDGINGIGIIGIGPVEVIWHDGNLDSDPLFMEAGTDPFALDPGSPCIDAGTPDTTGLFLPYNDIIGNTRVWDGDDNGTYIIDMGAYESGAPVSLQEPGTQVINASLKTSIYPNPSSEKVTIKWLNSHGRMHISLLNSTGSHLQSFIIPPGTDKMVIDLKPFTGGIYFVLLKDEAGTGNSEKLILIK